MLWDDLKRARANEVAVMTASLEQIPKAGQPLWLASIILLAPLFFGLGRSWLRLIAAGLLFYVVTAAKLLISIPLGLYLLADAVIVHTWFYSRVVRRMGEKE